MKNCAVFPSSFIFTGTLETFQMCTNASETKYLKVASSLSQPHQKHALTPEHLAKNFFSLGTRGSLTHSNKALSLHPRCPGVEKTTKNHCIFTIFHLTI